MAFPNVDHLTEGEQWTHPLTGQLYIVGSNGVMQKISPSLQFEEPDFDDRYLQLTGGALTGNLRTDSLIKSVRNSGMAFEVKPNDSDRTGCWDSNGNLTISSSATTSSNYIFTAKAKAYEIEGIDNPTAFRVLAGGAVKAGHDKEHPFMATAANDVVTKAYADANYLSGPKKKLSGTAVFNYTEERNFISLRPGEISTFTAQGEQTSILEEIRQVAFSGVDKDGNRHSPDLHAISTYQSWCSTAHLLNEECSQTFLRIVGGSHLGRDYCVFQYNKDVDIYFLGWEHENTGVLTSEMVRFLPDQKITIRIPDWFL